MSLSKHGVRVISFNLEKHEQRYVSWSGTVSEKPQTNAKEKVSIKRGCY